MTTGTTLQEKLTAILMDKSTAHISALEFLDNNALQAFIAECLRTGIAHPCILYTTPTIDMVQHTTDLRFGPLYVNMGDTWYSWITNGPVTGLLNVWVEKVIDTELAAEHLRAGIGKPYNRYVRHMLSESGLSPEQLRDKAATDLDASIEKYKGHINTSVSNIEAALLAGSQNAHIHHVRMYAESYAEKYRDYEIARFNKRHADIKEAIASGKGIKRRKRA